MWRSSRWEASATRSFACRGCSVTDENNQNWMPRHVAIIMDGNGRWAQRRGLKRTDGHAAAIETVREIIRASARKGIAQLTLYAFSTDNWSRPKAEVAFLMRLLAKYLVDERKEIIENNLRFTSIGDRNRLPKAVQQEIRKTEDLSRDNTGMLVCLALNYGGRDEIVSAAKRLSVDVARGKVRAEDINEDLFSRYLYTAGMLDPDLLIRTAGELRVSNFLLWQISYSEFWFTDVCWPDFREAHLDQALEDYARRERRFGTLEKKA
ncbi:MAG: isoprenyl transferase [Planctomycetota bacterium]